MKIRFAMLAWLIVPAFILAACGGSPAPAQSFLTDAPKYAGLKGDAVAGKNKFAGTCSACHGLDAKGLPSLGKDLTTSVFGKGLADAEFIAFVVKGRPVSDPANTTKVLMPPKGGNPALSDQDLADIVAYIRALQK
ncbi:MAG: cytochrome c [Chloroflexi bacterium]|nr:cytochrome c [Chloroflexota bacterium]